MRERDGEPNTHNGTNLTTQLWRCGARTAPPPRWLRRGRPGSLVPSSTSNAECVGIHASKQRDRFNAMEPIKQGIRNHYGAVRKGVAERLALRNDHCFIRGRWRRSGPHHA
jgi:hypothetical protein